MSNFYKFTAAGNLEAQRLLKRSFELDPEFGDSHAWWAYAVVLGMVYWDTEPDGSLLDEALAAAKRALSIDDQNAVFYLIMARTALARRDYTSSLAGNETAVRLNPTLAVAHCAMGDALAYEGRFDESQILMGCKLIAHLSGKLVFTSDFTHHPGFFKRMRHWLLSEAVFASPHEQ